MHRLPLLTFSSVASIGLTLAACDPAATADAGADVPTTADAPVTTDTPAADAPTTSDTPAPTDAPTTVVEACRAAAEGFGTRCAGSAPRPCVWAAYAELCEDGSTQLLLDSMDCLDDTTCRSFSDPNEGRACLDTLHTESRSVAASDAIEALCTACGGTTCDVVSGAIEIFPFLSDADVAAIEGCRGTACTIDEIAVACSDDIPALEAFAACAD